MINCSVLTPHVKELGKKLNIENETLLRGLFTVWRTNNPDKLDNEITEADLKELLKNDSQITDRVYYEGNITPDKNTIFVFGSNPEGRHGAGAAKIAREQFGAEYGTGEGLTGNAYALPTKDLRVTTNRSLRSIPENTIIESIKKLYEVAEQNPDKQFKVAYRNTDKASLNGYTGLEMIDMFIKAGKIPSNIIFSKEWVDTGKFNSQIKRENIVFTTEKGIGYPARTKTNADWSDITLALAEDDTTAGEKLTKKVAGNKYIAPVLEYFDDGSKISAKEVAHSIVNNIKDRNLPHKNIKLNIAGNGIYNLSESQEYYNNFVTDVIKELQNEGITIAEIRSGGQTGIDEAGIIAAQRLGIPASVHTTANWAFRGKDGKDVVGNERAFKERFKIKIENTLIDFNGNINWEYFETILNTYHNSQPDSMFTKGRHTLATRPEKHFTEEKNTLNHIKFVTQSMLNLFEGLYDADLPFVSEARASLKNQRDLMVLAAMFHDVAKVYSHGDIHGWESAEILRDVLGVDYNNRLAEWAVRHHMPMPFSHKAEFSLANPEALEVAKNIARDAKRLGIDAQTAINAFVLINAADIINGRELSVEDNWAKKAAAIGETRYGEDISVKNVLTLELSEKVELLKTAFEAIKDEDLGDSKYNYENQERFDYVAFPEGGREDGKLPYLNNKTVKQTTVPRIETDLSIISVNVSTPRAKLNASINANLQQKRAKLIADMFYEVCDEALEEKKEELREKGDFQTIMEWESSVYGRAKGIKTLPVKDLLRRLQNRFKEASSISEEWQKIWDNFVPLLEDACVQIERDSGLRLTIKSSLTSDGTNTKRELGGTFTEITEDEDPNMQDNTEGEATDSNELCTYKARHTDPHVTISLTTKHVLRRIPQLNEDYSPREDDLGNIEFVNEEQAHAILVQKLSEMSDPDDFAVFEKDEEGNIINARFPLLEQIALEVPWVTGLIDILESEPEKIPAFYHDFRNSFISYYMYKNGVLMPMNRSNVVGSTMAQIKRDYEQGNTLTTLSIYDNMGKINLASAEPLSALSAEIEELLDDLDTEDTEEVTIILDKAVELFKSIGMNVRANALKALLLKDNNHTAFKNALVTVDYIIEHLEEVGDEHLVTKFNSAYVDLSKLVGDVSDLENMASFRQGKKTYYSYSAPNFADIQITQLKKESAPTYIDREFGFDNFFFKDGEYRNKWLAWLRTDENIRKNLATFDLKTINWFGENTDYTEWTSEMIDKAFISAYFSAGYNEASQTQYAYYHYPIFSDSPVAKFIKMPRFTGKIEEIKGSILPLLREVVLQECDRIQLVLDREKAGVAKISNFDGKRGKQFCFFPQLNGVNPETNNNYLTDIIEFNKSGDVEGRNAYIEKALDDIMRVNFIKFSLTTSALTENELKVLGHGHLTAKEALEEYYWNSVYAQTQIIQLTAKDLAFYKSAVDFQKRYKQVYAAGKRLFTNSQYGRKFENVIYLKDLEVTYSKLEALKNALKKAVSEDRISKMDRDAILESYRKVNATDAQGFRSMTSYRAVLDMMGQWNPMMEDALNKIKAGQWDMSHYNLVWQTIKPFVYSTTVKPNGKGGKMRVMHQNKDSEFLLLAMFDIISADAYSPQIRALNEFMERNNIDLALYESGCKVGNQGIIDLNYSQARINGLYEAGKYTFSTGKTIEIIKKEWESPIKAIKNTLDGLVVRGKITSEEYDEIFEEYLPLNGREVYETLEQFVNTDAVQDSEFNRGERPNDTQYFNPEVVHTFSYNDYMIAQPTPEHLMDTETIFGSQFRNLIIADLPKDFKIVVNNVEYNRQEIIDLYNGLIIDNLLDSFDKLKEEFKSIEAVQKKLRSMVEGNPKFEKDILQALEIVEITHPVTGNKVKTFNIPLNNPSTTEKLQELILSAFKNGITKQKIKGGNAILCSNIGYTDELKRVVDTDGTLIGYECYLPATSKKWFESLLTEVEDNNGNTYQMLDIEKLDDELKEALGFRIPTEHKYSMVPLIIKGFLPQQNGSSIMVAKEITTASGCDYDVDKLFLMLYNFYMGKDGKAHKVVPPNPKEKPTEQWTKEERDNMIMDISRAILTHPDMGWINSKPGSFDTLKRQARKARILESPKMMEAFYRNYGITSGAQFEAQVESMDLDDLTDFVNKYSEEINPLELTTFKQFHKQNMTGGALIGIYANNTTMQAKFQETSLAIKDDYTITVNGITYKSLSDIYSQDGKLISFNCSESSAASVDNVKDPVLADLMQDTNTAKILCLLLRTGMPIKDACAFFNIPVIRNYIKNGGDLNKFESVAENILKVIEAVFGYSDNNKTETIASYKKDDINTSEIINHIAANYFIQTEEGESLSTLISYLMSEAFVELKKEKLAKSGFAAGDAKEFLINYLRQDARYLAVFSNIVKISEDLKKLTKVSRADSPNGAIKHNIEEAVIQARNVDLIHIKEEESTLEGLGQTLKNGKVKFGDSKAKMKATFMKSPVARLQAFHTLGIELPLQMVGKYFVQTNKWMQEKTLELFNQSPSGVLSANQLKSFYQALTYYYLTSIATFGNDGKHTFEEKRDWYIYEFPKYFVNLRNEHPELNQNSVIQKLEIESGKVLMKRSGKLTPTQRQMISNTITNLLYGDEMHIKLAADLMLYSFYTTGMNFGPDNFGMFFNVDFYNQFPEYVDALRKMQFYVNEHTNNSLMQNFMDQFYAIHGTYFTAHRDAPKKDEIPNPELQFEVKTVKNTNIEGEPWKYLTINYYLEEEVETEVGDEKKKIAKTVKYSKLYKLSNVTNETATYHEVGSIYDPFTGKNRYNAALTASELTSIVASEEAQKKAEEQKKYSYKRGARKVEVERLKDERLGDVNMLNAIAFVEGLDDNIEEPKDMAPSYYRNKGLSAEDAARYAEENSGDGINDDATTGSFDMSNFERENPEIDDSKYSVFEEVDLESYFEGVPVTVTNPEDYLPEEGNKQLEDPMC